MGSTLGCGANFFTIKRKRYNLVPNVVFPCSYRVYCMMGDGECSEGSVWEAMSFASIYKLDNLVAVLDVNRLGQSEPAPLQHDMEVYRKRCEAFG